MVATTEGRPWARAEIEEERRKAQAERWRPLAAVRSDPLGERAVAGGLITPVPSAERGQLRVVWPRAEVGGLAEVMRHLREAFPPPGLLLLLQSVSEATSGDLGMAASSQRIARQVLGGPLAAIEQASWAVCMVARAASSPTGEAERAVGALQDWLRATGRGGLRMMERPLPRAEARGDAYRAEEQRLLALLPPEYRAQAERFVGRVRANADFDAVALVRDEYLYT